MKKLFVSIICIVMLCAVLCLSGCGEKTAITAEAFKTAMESKGYTVEDATEQFFDQSHVEKVYIALPADRSYQIEFYLFDSAETARMIYSGNKNNFEASIAGNYSQSHAELANYSRYYLTADGRYKVLSQIDSTMIYIDASSEYKSVIKDILDEFGY